MPKIDDIKYEPLSKNQKTFLSWLRGNRQGLSKVIREYGISVGRFSFWMRNDEFREEVRRLLELELGEESDLLNDIEVERFEQYKESAKRLRKMVTEGKGKRPDYLI